MCVITQSTYPSIVVFETQNWFFFYFPHNFLKFHNFCSGISNNDVAEMIGNCIINFVLIQQSANTNTISVVVVQKKNFEFEFLLSPLVYSILETPKLAWYL
jgi:hypothetical protein